jgi:hypothetical protein
LKRKSALLTALAAFAIGVTGLVLVLQREDDRATTSLGSGAPAQSQPEDTGPGDVGPGTARPSGQRRFRPTYLPPGLELRRSERENTGNAHKHVFYLSFYDDGTAQAGPEGGILKPPGREVIVNVTEGGPAPTDADFDVVLKAEPTARRVAVRGKPGVKRSGTDNVASVKWRERDDVSIFVSIRGLGEDELLRIANGLVPE